MDMDKPVYRARLMGSVPKVPHVDPAVLQKQAERLAEPLQPHVDDLWYAIFGETFGARPGSPKAIMQYTCADCGGTFGEAPRNQKIKPLRCPHCQVGWLQSTKSTPDVPLSEAEDWGDCSIDDDDDLDP
jgi:DNA-directed RNA polymerase subunit RPC12/RpoP